MYRYHGRANSIRHYNNPQNPVNPDSNLFIHRNMTWKPVGDTNAYIAATEWLHNRLAPDCARFC